MGLIDIERAGAGGCRIGTQQGGGGGGSRGSRTGIEGGVWGRGKLLVDVADALAEVELGRLRTPTFDQARSIQHISSARWNHMSSAS